MLANRLYRFVRSTQILQRSVSCYTSHLSRKKKWMLIRKSYYTPFTLMGIWSFISPKDKSEGTDTGREMLLLKADAMFEQGHYKQIYDLLSNYRDSRDVEILWRLCRALYLMSETASKSEAKKMIYEGYDLICTALSIQEDHYAVHKWMSVFLDSKSSQESMKSRMQQLYNVKKHMLRAAELNPEDATTWYMLGSWCFQVSDLAWYQRKLATLIYGKPPSSTFEEALQYFESAMKLDPNFCRNLLMLGKTYLKLDRKEDAVKYLRLVSEFPVRNDEDHRAKQEAMKLLNNI